MKGKKAILLFVVLSLVLVACGPSETPEPPVQEPATKKVSPTEKPAVGARQPKNGDHWVVGWTPISDPVDQTRLTFDAGIRDAVEAAGGELLYCSPSPQGGAAGDPALQANCVDNFITQDVDAIVLWPIDVGSSINMIKKANEADIPVFLWFTSVPADSGVDVKLSLKSPNRGGANACGHYLVDALTKKYGEPKGLILDVAGAATTTDGQERSNFFKEITDKYPDIEVVTKNTDWGVTSATNVVRDWMTANPQTDAIYVATTCSFTPAVETVLKDMGLWFPEDDPRHIFVAGVDACNQALYHIKCGGYINMAADMAYTAAPRVFGDLVLKYLQTGDLPDLGEIPTGDPLFPTAVVKEEPGAAGKIVNVKELVVTQENVTDPGIFGNKLESPPNGLSECPTTGPQPKNGDHWVVGWTPISDPVDQTRLTFDAGIRDAVEAVGGELLYCSPSPQGGAAGDPALQANCVDNFITQDVDAIVLWPIDVGSSINMIKKANEADIPVFLWFTSVPADSGVDVKLSLKSPNRGGANACGHYLVDALTKKYGEPKGLILDVAGAATTTDGQERSNFFKEITDKYPDIEVVTKNTDWGVTSATNVVRDWMTANPQTDAIYVATTCSFTPAVETVLKDMGLWFPEDDPRHIFVAGVDACNQALYHIKCGGYINMAADMAYTAAPRVFGDLVLKYLQTGDLPDLGEIPTGDPLFPTAVVKEEPGAAGKIVNVKELVVTQENVTDPGIFGNKLESPPNGLSECE